MMLFRNACERDLDAIHHLASQGGGAGITTLPSDKSLLHKRLNWSCESFQKSLNKPSDEYYLFVLEETESKKIVGTSAIESSIGHELPFYTYKLSKRTRVCQSLHLRSDYEILSLVNDHQDRSEICTLFLDPDFRHKFNGLLLSRARFLFIGQHPSRFAPTIIAEMRGVSDEEGHSPFWDNVGRHFFHMPFFEADQLTLATNRQFIADLMPRSSLYVKLLAPSAQAVIAQPHKNTVPAMSILLKEGFRYHNYVDIFDAGPILEAQCSEIQSITRSRILPISSFSDEVSSNSFILANTKTEFRATLNQAIVNESRNSCIISKKIAELLELKPGDHLHLTPLNTEQDYEQTQY